MKIIQLSRFDHKGGAAIAAYRLHHSLRDSGIDSQMLVDLASLGDSTVHGRTSKLGQAMALLRPQLADLFTLSLGTSNPVLHSPAILSSRWPAQIKASDADVVHLHWTQREMISIADIACIHKPIVWTLHDMWAFCGAEHYTTDNRWRDGYRRNNRPANESGFDLNLWTWKRKRKHWCRPFQIVCPSRWLADCVRESFLMRDWPVSVVPNPIDLVRWAPIDQRLARHLMGLPQDIPLLLFGAIGGGSDPRKGSDLLFEALAYLRTEPSLNDLHLVVFGQLAPPLPPRLGFPVHYMGQLHDDLSLRALYSAADAMVIPSRQDNLPNTGLEAHACGTPVVAFNTGGLPDIVADRFTGALASPFDPVSLGLAISWVLEDSQRLRTLRAAARQRAETLWNRSRVADMYEAVYFSALGH